MVARQFVRLLGYKLVNALVTFSGTRYPLSCLLYRLSGARVNSFGDIACTSSEPGVNLYVTTAYSTYTYELGNIYTISWFSWDVRTHIWKINNVKVILSYIQRSRIFPMFTLAFHYACAI